ncbi:unnamed protein product [Paramecium octaurelia]|uniref:Uncharacterized protein n=1 Tax=Paramecium octaurelia TaxID=43137 RepID=A0A8S1YM55_PAROT|nr:unnamed protein product [Paramecium octaurelia]
MNTQVSKINLMTDIIILKHITVIQLKYFNTKQLKGLFILRYDQKLKQNSTNYSSVNFNKLIHSLKLNNCILNKFQSKTTMNESNGIYGFNNSGDLVLFQLIIHQIYKKFYLNRFCIIKVNEQQTTQLSKIKSNLMDAMKDLGYKNYFISKSYLKLIQCLIKLTIANFPYQIFEFRLNKGLIQQRFLFKFRYCIKIFNPISNLIQFYEGDKYQNKLNFINLEQTQSAFNQRYQLDYQNLQVQTKYHSIIKLHHHKKKQVEVEIKQLLGVCKNKSSYEFKQQILLGLEPRQNKLDYISGCSLRSIRRAHQKICNSYQICQNNRNYRSCYRHMITVIVTYWGYCDKDMKQKLQKIQNRKMQMMFFGNNTSESLCQQIDQIIDKLRGESVNQQILKSSKILIWYIMIRMSLMKFGGRNFIFKVITESFYVFKNFQWDNISKKLLIDCCYAQFNLQNFQNVLKRIDFLIENDQLRLFKLILNLRMIVLNIQRYCRYSELSKFTKETNSLKYIKKKCKYCGQILVLINSLCW